MLRIPGDPQAAGPVVRPMSPMAATAGLAGRVLACSASFVMGGALAMQLSEPAAPGLMAPEPAAPRLISTYAEARLVPREPVVAGSKAPVKVASREPVRIPFVPPAEGEEGRLGMPVLGLERSALADNFEDRRGARRHLALDIMAPRGTPVVAVAEGEVAKVYRHALGGLSVYQYDRERRRSYYYAHLQGFAPGLAAGDYLRRGDLVGYVGTTGNASPTAPHLHFAILDLDSEGKWWKGTPVNPYPLLE